MSDNQQASNSYSIDGLIESRLRGGRGNVGGGRLDFDSFEQQVTGGPLLSDPHLVIIS